MSRGPACRRPRKETPQMKLLGTPGSPYARKARIALLEKNLVHEFVFDRPSNPDSKVARYNPLGKIPVLLLDGGRALYDSAVIVEYADGVGSGPRLIPEDFAARIEVRRWEALGDGIADATVLLTHDHRYGEAGCEQAPWYRRQYAKIERGLAAMERDLDGREHCCGAFGLADIAAGMALGYLDYAFAALDWRARHAGLKAYAERLFARASFRATRPEA
jgi:glutathione S-transferase